MLHYIIIERIIIVPPSIHIFKITAKIQSELHTILDQFQSIVTSHGGNIISHSISSIMHSLSFIAIVQIYDKKNIDHRLPIERKAEA